jgi:hypothetical protein
MMFGWREDPRSKFIDQRIARNDFSERAAVKRSKLARMSEAISGFLLSSATPHVAPLMRATEIKSPGLAAGASSV